MTNNAMHRRTLLKGGIAATGAAYVAPQVIRTTVAGAQTTTCYALKFEPGCENVAGGDPSCPAAMNNEIAAAISGSVTSGCPGPLSVSGVDTRSGTVTVTDPSCELKFVGFKAGSEASGGGCYWVGPGGPGQSGSDPDAVITLGTTSASIASPAKDISHITVVVCCTASSEPV